MRELPFCQICAGCTCETTGFRLEQEHEMRRELLIRKRSISSNRRKSLFHGQRRFFLGNEGSSRMGAPFVSR